MATTLDLFQFAVCRTATADELERVMSDDNWRIVAIIEEGVSFGHRGSTEQPVVLKRPLFVLGREVNKR